MFFTPLSCNFNFCVIHNLAHHINWQRYNI